MSLAGQVGRRVRRLMSEVLIEKRRCYQAVFLGDGKTPTMEAERVLADIKRFCRGDRSAFDPNPQQAARLEGRREVWLRLQHYLNLTDAQVARLMEVESEQY